MIDNTTEFKPNEWSWNRNASVLYIDHPAGVGFSICGAGIGKCKVDDLTDSEENMKSLNSWYAKFPEFKQHKLWISGESYAGVYVPYWVWQIDKQNKNATSELDKIPLQGMLVGNGVTNWTFDCNPADVGMGHAHALMDDVLFDAIKSANCDYTGTNFGRNATPECMDYLDEYFALISNMDIYNIFKPVYPDDPPK